MISFISCGLHSCEVASAMYSCFLASIQIVLKVRLMSPSLISFCGDNVIMC